MIRLFVILICSWAILASCQKGNVNKEMRSPGEIAFRSYCQSCHILPKASMKTDEEWPQIVSKYGDKVKLSEAQQADIISYLTSQN